MTQTSPKVDALPLSPIQTGMLFQTLWHPESGYYLQQFRIRFHREIDPEAMRRAWDFLANRHDSLRSGFIFDSEKNPEMLIESEVTVPFRFEDWSTEPKAKRQKRLRAFLRKDRSESFLLEDAPLMRLALFQFGPEDFLLVWTSHHLLFDGRSRYILLQELPAVYEAMRTGMEPRLPKASRFERFVRWIAAERFEFAESYWRRVLDGVSEPTPVGFEKFGRRQDAEDNNIRERWQTTFSSGLQARLERFCKDNDLTPNTVLQGAWALVLSRYTGRRDVIFGAPRAGRHGPMDGFESTVGVFVNTLPVRATVDDNEDVLDFLRGLRRNWVEMRPYEQTPLRDIHRWCRMPEGRDLFSSLIGYERFQMAERLAADSVWWKDSTVELDGWTNYALTIQAYRGKGLEVVFSYDPERFNRASIERLAGHLRTVVSGFMSTRVRSLSEVPLLTGAENRKLLTDWNATRVVYPEDADVATVFSRVALKNPDRVALILGDKTLTYGELDKRSDAVASWLAKSGVGGGDHIGVLHERSFAQVVAIVGILKAGAAYVPLDSEYPRERIRFMVEDAELKMVLGDAENRGVLSGLAIDFHTIDDVTHNESCGRVSLAPDPEETAYIIYTSGSTGTPKGVAVPHRGILRLVFGADYAEFGPEWTFLQMAPVSFDASTFELWGALLHGARCVLYPYRRPQLNELSRQISRHGVDTLWLTAALFNFVIDEAPEILRPIKQLLTGGEALSPVHVGRALEQLPDTQLINGYGPTETTTFACCHRISRKNFNADVPVPIGKPIGNTTCYVLDASMQPVPVGVEGELYIGGAGVALGYWNRSELTSERFVPNPFDCGQGAKLYRTGDLATWREDGRIEFRGRVDDQVKIRGFRIEPGEVSRALQDHPAVKQATVLVVEAKEGGKELAAFYTQNHEGDPNAAVLRAYLADRVPSYMLPASYSLVSEIPMTVNGKVDRVALLASVPENDVAADGSQMPSTDLEKNLAALWSEILGVSEIALDDSFFCLGGDSIQALQLIHRVHQLHRVDVPYQVFFENPTVSRFRDWIQSREECDNVPPLNDYRVETRGESWSLDRERAGNVELFLRPENRCRRNVTRAFYFDGGLDIDRLVRSIRWVSARHEAMSTRFIPCDGKPMLQARSRGELPVSVEDLSGIPVNDAEEEVQRAFLRECEHRFDPADEWVHRFFVYTLSDTRHAFIANFHHSNFDGTSLTNFYGEISEVYRAFGDGEHPSLPEPAPQQTDVFNWLHGWFTPERKARSRDYWKRKLADLPPIKLPVIETVEGHRQGTGRIEYVRFGPAQVQDLHRTARRLGVTVYQLCLAGFNAAIGRVGHNEDIAVGIAVNLRTHGELEPVMGNFGNLLVLRTRLHGNPRFSDIVRRVEVEAKEAVENRYFMFDNVTELLGEKEIFDDPLRHLRFIKSPEGDGAFDFPGLTCIEIPREHHQPMGLLTAHMREMSDRIEIKVTHIPDVFPTDALLSVLSLYEFIMSVVALGADPHLSDFPKLGEPLTMKSGDGASDCRMSSSAERIILEVFREVLENPAAGPEDSFFDLGGHSLMAAKLVYRIQQRLSVEIPFCVLFDHPTPRRLAGALNDRTGAGDRPSLNALVRRPRNRRAKVNAYMCRWIMFMRNPASELRNITRSCILRGPVDVEILRRSLQWVVDRHDALRTRVIEGSGGVDWREVAPVDVELICLNRDGGGASDRADEIDAILAEDSGYVFRVDSFPFHRFRLIRLNAREHVFIANFHHFLFDGRSLGIFFSELSAAYSSFHRGREPDLAPPAYQLNDLMLWFDDWIAQGGMDRQRSYWVKKLRGMKPLKYPFDLWPDREGGKTGTIILRSLGGEWSRRVHEKANELGVSYFSFLHAVVNVLIYSYGNRHDMHSAIVCDIRNHPDAATVIGSLGSLLVVRTELSENPSFREIALQTRRAALEGLQHNLLPFQELMKIVPQAEKLCDSPLSQVKVIEEPPYTQSLKLPGIDVEFIPRRVYTSPSMLVFQLPDKNSDLVVKCMARPEYFSVPRAEALLDQYVDFLSMVLDNPDRKLSDFPTFESWFENRELERGRRNG